MFKMVNERRGVSHGRSRRRISLREHEIWPGRAMRMTRWDRTHLWELRHRGGVSSSFESKLHRSSHCDGIAQCRKDVANAKTPCLTLRSTIPTSDAKHFPLQRPIFRCSTDDSSPNSSAFSSTSYLWKPGLFRRLYVENSQLLGSSRTAQKPTYNTPCF